MRAKLFFLVGIGRQAKNGPRYRGDFVVFFAFLLPIRSAVFLTSVWSLRSRATSLWSIVVFVVLSYFAKFRHLLGAQRPPSSGFPGLSCHALPHPCILLRPSSPFSPVPSGPRGPPPSPCVCDPLPSGPPSSPPGPGFFASWSTKSSPLVSSLRSLRLRSTSFWSSVNSSGARFFRLLVHEVLPARHFVAVLASARHFLLVHRQLLRGPVFPLCGPRGPSRSTLGCGPCVRASLPPGLSSSHPGPTSRSPFPGRNSP